MGALDYSVALDGLTEATPVVLEKLLRRAAEPLGATDLTVYLADVQHMVLQPILLTPDFSDPILAEEAVSTSIAGRVFLSGRPHVAEVDGGRRVWAPLVERGERTGVLVVTLPEVDDTVLAECVRLGLFAGLLVRGFTPITDLFALRRWRRPMTLAAGMQWDLLPPLTAKCTEATVCGRLEPAYEIAGDAFDYALNVRHLDAGIFDGMGHGVGSTLLTTLAVGAYRHGRRGGEGPAQVAEAIDEALRDQYDGEAFATAVLMRLNLETGMLEWSNAGHPPPLLMRDRKVVRELSTRPTLPLGLGGDRLVSGQEDLEPGDSVLLYTDGVVEGRSAAGDQFSVERLIDYWQREMLSGLQPEQALLRLAQDVTAFGAGKLRDDATLLCLTWHGPQT